MNGQGADTDTLVAAARAYVNALNKLLVKRERSAPVRRADGVRQDRERAEAESVSLQRARAFHLFVCRDVGSPLRTH